MLESIKYIKVLVKIRNNNMKRLKFTKMQGIGNDYIYIDGTKNVPQDLPNLAVKLSDRHFGIGGDGIVVIAKSNVADFQMIMLNNDGSYAEMCGNASRCIGKYVYEKGLTNKKEVTLETKAGIKNLSLNISDGVVLSVTVNMGKAILEPTKIPLNYSTNMSVPIEVENKKYLATCVSMGNPHACIISSELYFDDFEKIGRKIENYYLFPKKTNVEFIKVIDRNNVEMRVWERGTGETLACGTGACASVVACVLQDLTDRIVTVKLRGGNLLIEYKENGEVIMTGEAKFVFDGEVII